jgi:hypothetical protein
MNPHCLTRGVLVYVAAGAIAYGQMARDSASQMQKQADEFIYLVTSAAPGVGPVIKGKPFCATAQTETGRVLEDGNRIRRKNVMRLCRDRDGRTRREQTLGTLGAPVPIAPKTFIFLYDPVQAVSYVLDPHEKVARRFIFPQVPTIRGTIPGSSVPEVQTENLGSRLIEGLTCAGTRKTTRIPAGALGNAVPIVSVTETWFSSDIESIVDSQTRDPRFGTVHYRLIQIERKDLTPDLFKPPADYTVEAGMSLQHPK